MISIGEVDIEEQLNRLRQQEKRSMAFAAFGQESSSPSSSPEPSGEVANQLESLCDVRNVTVPNSPIAIPAILQPPESLSVTRQKQQQQQQLRNPEMELPTAQSVSLTAAGSGANISPSSPPNLTSILSGSASDQTSSSVQQQQQPPSLSHSVVATMKSSSCVVEPFKQLDTIIEGRGLLLGAEQQADPSYTNRLRRLSGNSRRISLGAALAADSTTSLASSTTSTTPLPMQPDEWCRCDLASPRKLSIGRRLSSGALGSTDLGSRRGSNEVAAVPAAQSTAAPGTSIGSSSRFVLDTMKNLARRTFNNLATISSATSTTTSGSSDSTPAALFRQKRSSSMVVGSGNTGFGLRDQTVSSGQPTLPSRFLREKVREQQQHQSNQQRNKDQSCCLDDVEDDEEESSSASSITVSADDSSLMSLDDAENYLAKNKDNQMKHGQSLESSSSSSSSSSTSSLSNLNLNLDDDDNDNNSNNNNNLKRSANNQIAAAQQHRDARKSDSADTQLASPQSRRRTSGETKLQDDNLNEEEENGGEEDEEDEEEEEEEEEDEEEEEEAPKICYKCNKLIRVESHLSRRAFFGETIKHNASESSPLHTAHEDFDASEQQQQQQLSSAAGKSRRSSQATRTHHSRRQRTAARRSASMNSADLETSEHQHQQHQQHQQQHQQQQQQHIAGRRKNKWHIQRNLAPKLKRQRSFSANYAPEVPNPVMPPPRRFSAAPSLSCPHRNKSSSHSSSSLHRTYSIDSSESMITVIPAHPGQEPIKRTSRGSLSCNSGVSTGGGTAGAGGLDTSGSYYNLPKSPLSPRSPSRCSPSLLTPNSSEPPNSLLDQSSLFSTSTNTTNCSSIAAPTVICQLPQTSTSQQQQLRSEGLVGSGGNRSQLDTSDQPFNLSSLSPICSSRSKVSLSAVVSGEDDNLSLAVENGTSYNSSRFDLDTVAGDEASGAEQAVEFDDDDEYIDRIGYEQVTVDQDNRLSAAQISSQAIEGQSDNLEQQPNTSASVVSETINDFCAKHSREELEFLVGQVGYLKISDCYFSERSSTLCMVIEVDEK